MSTGMWPKVFQAALDSMGVRPGSLGPLPLLPALGAAFSMRGVEATSEDMERLAWAALSDDPNEPLRLCLLETLHQWDNLSAGDWTGETKPNTRERRRLIYLLLAMTEEWVAACDERLPPYIATEAVPVIGGEWTHWYTPARREQHRFFWPRLERYLLETKRWPLESVRDLDRASTAIVERLSDPEGQGAVAVRGLVVGYVQSGKTANFTAVIAKAVDAGYRLIIVLAGTLNILRNQTQRRLDKELLGKELIVARPNDDGQHDYIADIEWDEFIAHGGLPGRVGGCDWQRLTTARWDYRSLKAGIDALEFKRIKPGRPYNDPANLHADAARLLVVKKAPGILGKVIKDLKRLSVSLASVPTLIIDDESDLASVNTLPPKVDEEAKRLRTKTNSEINRLLQLLPRASYVGYTATPAASVLMDDRDELFPRDFIIPLPKPRGYMGVSEFIDPSECAEADCYREQCFVRRVEGDDTEAANLPRAIDAFVLAGCVKLYRERGLGVTFRHHTMLVHRSHHIREHACDREVVLEFFRPDRFMSQEGQARLGRLLLEDVAAVCEKLRQVRGADASDVLPPVQELPGLIEEFFQRVQGDGVLVVNGDPKNEDRAPDFDSRNIWAVLVGGTKLSRGYTVEGLTVSYYRRKVSSADTLMQMGRWFGFRKNYEDLVRLFLGREERKGKAPLDLYDEFRACCLDEEEFRGQLIRYALDGENPLRPEDVPPLVYSSGLLEPTSKNKMLYARRAFGNCGGDHRERTLLPTDHDEIEQNWKAFEALVSGVRLEHAAFGLRVKDEAFSFKGVAAALGAEEVLVFLRTFVWSREGVYQDVLDFLEAKEGDPEISDWCVVVPTRQSAGLAARELPSGLRLDAHTRARTNTARRPYKVISEPGHVFAAKWIAGAIEAEGISEDLQRLRVPRRAVLVAYACMSREETRANLGFFTAFPKNGLPWKVAFVTNRAERHTEQ